MTITSAPHTASLPRSQHSEPLLALVRLLARAAARADFESSRATSECEVRHG